MNRASTMSKAYDELTAQVSGQSFIAGWQAACDWFNHEFDWDDAANEWETWADGELE